MSTNASTLSIRYVRLILGTEQRDDMTKISEGKEVQGYIWYSVEGKLI